jgi:hypothetical protein
VRIHDKVLVPGRMKVNYIFYNSFQPDGVLANKFHIGMISIFLYNHTDPETKKVSEKREIFNNDRAFS